MLWIFKLYHGQYVIRKVKKTEMNNPIDKAHSILKNNYTKGGSYCIIQK